MGRALPWGAVFSCRWQVEAADGEGGWMALLWGWQEQPAIRGGKRSAASG